MGSIFVIEIKLNFVIIKKSTFKKNIILKYKYLNRRGRKN